MSSYRSVARKALKGALWTVFILFLVLVLLIGAILLPPVQQFITNKAVNFLEQKLDTKVSLGKLYIGFPKAVVIEKLYVEDQSRDTLVYLNKLKVNIDLLGLLDNKLNISHASIDGLTGHISRSHPDSLFNFDFIPKAFASSNKTEATQAADTTQSQGMKISVGDVYLSRIHGSFRDQVTGVSIWGDLGELALSVKTFNLDDLDFEVDKLKLKKTHVAMEIVDPPLPPVEDTDTSSTALTIKLNEGNLEAVRFEFKQPDENRTMDVDVGSFHLSESSFNLLNEYVSAKNIVLAESSFLLIQESTPDSLDSTTTEYTAQSFDPLTIIPWHFDVESLTIENQTVVLEDLAAPKTPGEFNAANLRLNSIQLQAKNIHYNTQLAQLELLAASGTEQNSGLMLNELRGILSVDSKQILVEELFLATPESRLSLNAETRFDNFQDLMGDIPRATFDIRIEDTELTVSEVFPFSPELRKSLAQNGIPALVVWIDAKLDGTTDEINLQHLKATLNGDTRVEMNGTIRGATNPKTAQGHIALQELSTTRAAIAKLVPPKSIPETIRVPESLSLVGEIEGSLNDFTTELLLQSSSGDLDLMASMVGLNDERPKYSGRVASKNIDLGKILIEPDSLGKLVFHFDVEGEGFDPETMIAELNGEISSVEFRQHKYRGLQLLADAKNGVIDLHGEITDSLVQFSLNACADFVAATPYYRADINLKGIDLYGMGLSDKDLRIAGELNTQASIDSTLNIDGELTTSNVLIIRDGNRYPMDSIHVRLHSTPDSTGLSVRSGAINGHFESNIALSEIPKTVQQHVNHYYHVTDSVESSSESDRYFSFDFRLEPTPALTNILVPQLSNFSPGSLSGHFKEQTDIFDLEVVMPSITYGNIQIDSLDLRVESAADSLRYALAIKQTDIQDFRIDKTTLSGALADQKLTTIIQVRDSLNRPSLRISGDFEQQEGSYQFHLNTNGLMLGGEDWQVPEDNYFAFGAEGVKAYNMMLRNGAQQIELTSESETFNAPLDLNFDGFLLSDLARVVQQDTLALRGSLNGSVNWTFPDTIAHFTTDLTISDLAAMGTDIGDLRLRADYTPARLKVKTDLTGNGNDMQANGVYLFAPSDSLNFTADIHKLNTAIAQPFVSAYLDSLNGSLNGKIDVFGKPSAPQFTGHMNFKDIRFKVPSLGTHYLLKNETVQVENSGITLERFVIRDTDENEAIIAGKVSTPGSGYDNLKFNIDLSTKHFMLINSPEEKDAILFGKVMLTSNFKVRGNMERPIIEGSATIDDESDLSMVVPQGEAQIQKSGGIDRFIDRHSKGSNIMTRSAAADSTRTTLRGIDLHADLSIARSTKLKLFLDEQRDNYVLARGDASLIFGIDPSGKITLTGRYEIAEGEYQLVYRTVVRRTFDIRPGSHITWVGDPLQAKLDITAQYNVDADALGLIQDQIATTNQAELNKYRQELPFWLLLNLRGDLSEPVIDFDIELPPESRGAFNGQVQAKLKQLNQESSESELNKQVFSLLILGRFVPSDPTSTGGGMSSTARNSVSRLLNTQLSKFSDKYVKGVDLNVSLDSYEDYSTGQAEGRTELNLGLGKSFINDRLNVSVGGSIDLEGEYRKHQKASDLIGDISAEYKLTEDGNWRLRGFRKNSYEGIIDGELVKTGAALIFTRSYNELHELFRSPKKEEEPEEQKEKTDE